MLRVLQIEEYTINEVEKVKKYALEHPYDEKYREEVLAKKALPVGDNPDHVVHIHDGYRAVYSISLINSVKFHHLSISVETNYPDIRAAELILELFGMGSNVMELDNVWLEEDVRALNFIKVYK